MKVRNISYLLLVLIFLLSLCGCGKDDTSNPTEDNINDTSQNETVTENDTGILLQVDSDQIIESENVESTVTDEVIDSVVSQTNNSSSTTTLSTTQTTTAITTTNNTTTTTQQTFTEPTVPSGVTAVITLGSTPTYKGKGVTVSKNKVTITEAGTYQISGSMNGQLVINDTDKAEDVNIQLCGVSITSNIDAPVYVQNAKKVIFTTASGTVNTITDNRSVINSENAACIYSDDDLIFNGEGKLIVNGNFNNGIRTKNDLKITSGTIEVKAAKNGIRGNESVEISGGNVKVTCQKDGIKCSETLEADKGFILIEGGNITVTAGDDALQSTKSITISGGKCILSAEGKLYNCDTENGISIANGCVTEV